jgi:hypothetical protein
MSNEEPTNSGSDTEGHMPFKRTVTPAGEEGGDSEGHAVRSGRIEPAEEGDDDPDDTEGHRIYAGHVGVVFG